MWSPRRSAHAPGMERYHVCFVVMVPSSQRTKNAYCTSLTSNQFLHFFFCPSLSFAKDIIRQTRTEGGRNLAYVSASQSSKPEGGCPSLSSWHLRFSLERKHDHLPWTQSNGVCPHCSILWTCESQTNWNRNKLSNAT